MIGLRFTWFMLILAVSCKLMDDSPRIHGHRGYRGLWPENSQRGFEEAISVGVDAIELDVVVTGDGQLLVSHDPFMHSDICAKPSGEPISTKESPGINIYQMTTAEAQAYWIGQYPHPRFPNQILHPTHKPTLEELIIALEEIRISSSNKEWIWNIELKFDHTQVGQYYPQASTYAALFLKLMEEKGIKNRTIIQCFDPVLLNELNQQDSDLKLVYLTEDSTRTADGILSDLHFKPYGYSPNHLLIDANTVDYCKKENIQLITWTVNTVEEAQRLVDLGVRDIITDYPEMLIHAF